MTGIFMEILSKYFYDSVYSKHLSIYNRWLEKQHFFLHLAQQFHKSE